MISGVAHLSFTVSDLEKSLRFYSDLLGFKVKFETERSGPVADTIIGIPGVRIKIGMLTLDDFSLELIQYVAPIGKKLNLSTNNVGCAHLAFYVEDIEKVYKSLSQKGINFRSAPTQIKEGALAGWKAVYFYDPDGITLELMQQPVA
jgi:catechol 2,3-dioxygenase-like lactoylglutathione lyase family enzyme